jgi:hypothetical protein
MEETGRARRHIPIEFADGTQHLGTKDDYDDLCLEDDPRMMVYRRSDEWEGDYDVDGDGIPYYWPPFRNGTPEIFTPVTTKDTWAPCPCREGCQKSQRKEDDYVTMVHDPNVVVPKSSGFHEFVEKRTSPDRVAGCPPQFGSTHRQDDGGHWSWLPIRTRDV